MKKKVIPKKWVIIFYFIASCFNGFAQKQLELLGQWRGSFPLNSGNEIPFNFEIVVSGKKDTSLFFINGTDKYNGGKLVTKKDSIYISLDQFDTEIALAIINDQSLSGFWRKQNGAGSSFPIHAEKNKPRFSSSTNLSNNTIGNSYSVEFTNDAGKKIPSVGLFKQEGNRLFATFLRISGDSRYSEGIIEGNEFKLSMFIGNGPLLFVGKINKDGSINGEQIGLKSNQTFTAIKNDSALLPATNNLTIVNNDKPFNFSLQNALGKKISLDDDRYKNKPVIVTIGGTWCLNCADEAMFLAPWYRKNQSRGIEMITVQFEVVDDFVYAQKTMNRFKQKFNIPYEMVFGGTTDNAKVLAALPALEKFYSFPTTLFIDKNRKVFKIHTGFSGPATGKFYTEFIREFNQTVDELLKQ